MRPWSVWRHLISWSQLLGGAAGYMLLGVTAIQQRSGMTSNLGPMPAAWFVTSAFAFGVAIVAGILLLRQHRNGIPWSIAVQVAQVVTIVIPGTLTYQFSAGVNLLLTITPFGLGFHAGVAANFAAFPTSNSPFWLISINLVAGLAAVVLIRKNRQLTTVDSQTSTARVAAV